jgi:outer membrane receptor protein involved in Fe transport
MTAFMTLGPTLILAQERQAQPRQPERGAATPAQLAQADKVFEFNIPPKPLAEAIADLSATTGLQVLYKDQQLSGLRSNPVVGSYTLTEALHRLLAGTGFTARVTSANTLTVERIVTGEDRFQIEPTTVTGEKTERTLQNTATSVSVLTGEDLKEHPNITTLDDALSRMPNVLDVGTGNFAPTIRGSDTTGPAEGVVAFIAGTRPRVTTQLDGRPLTYNELVFGQTGLWDVERVEVFRGPQTTLQGRNSIAGTIIVNTKDPTFDYEIDSRVIAGNFDTQQFSGAASGPVIKDQLAVRLSFDQRNHDSWVNVIRQPIGVDNIEEEESTNVRAKLLFTPNALPDLNAKLTFTHIDTRQPQVEFVNRPFDERKLTSNEPGQFPLFETESDSGVVNLNYFLTSEVELRNTAAYSSIAIDRLTDPGSGIAKILADEFSNEFILDYAAPQRGLRGLLGVYYFTADQEDKIDIQGGAFDDDTDTISLFGEGTFTLFEKLDLTAGGRYEREKRKRVGSLGPFSIHLDKTFEAFLPKFSVAYRLNEQFTLGATVQRGFNAGGAGIAFLPPFPSFVFDEEFVWNYEVFFRSTWLDERLTVNGNLFFEDFEDQQRSAFLVPGDPFASVIRNAESAHAYGAELTLTWLPLKGLETFGGLGLLKTEIDKFSASLEDLSGNEFARAPNVTATLGALYRHASGFSIGFDGRYVSDYFSDDLNNPVDEVDAFFVLNMQAAYEIKNFRLFAFVNNIFDRDYELLIDTIGDFGQLSDPREFGFGLQVSF